MTNSMNRESAFSNLQILYNFPLDRIYVKNEANLWIYKSSIQVDQARLDKIKNVIDKTLQYASCYRKTDRLYVVIRSSYHIHLYDIPNVLLKINHYYQWTGKPFIRHSFVTLPEESSDVIKNIRKLEESFRIFLMQEMSEDSSEKVLEHSPVSLSLPSADSMEELKRYAEESTEKVYLKFEQACCRSDKVSLTKKFMNRKSLLYLEDLANDEHFLIIQHLIESPELLPKELIQSLITKAAGRNFFNFINWLLDICGFKSLSEGLSEYFDDAQLWQLVCFAGIHNRMDFIDSLSQKQYQKIRKDLILWGILSGKITHLESHFKKDKELPEKDLERELQRAAFLKASKMESMDALDFLTRHWFFGGDLNMECMEQAIKADRSAPLNFILDLSPHISIEKLMLFSIQEKSIQCLKYLVKNYQFTSEFYQRIGKDLLLIAVEREESVFFKDHLLEEIEFSEIFTNKEFQTSLFLKAAQNKSKACLECLMRVWPIGDDLIFDCAIKAVKKDRLESLIILFENRPRLPLDELILCSIHNKKYRCLSLFLALEKISKPLFEKAVTKSVALLDTRALQELLKHESIREPFLSMLNLQLDKMRGAKEENPILKKKKNIEDILQLLNITIV